MKVIELLKSKEWSGKVIDCVLRFALSFALALAQVFGGYAPISALTPRNPAPDAPIMPSTFGSL